MMNKILQKEQSGLALSSTKLVFKYDPYENYSQWRLDDYYSSMPESLQDLLSSLGLASYMNLESSYDFTRHIKELKNIAKENSHLSTSIGEFIEVLQAVESLREEDTQNELSFIVDSIKEELVSWDKSVECAISRKTYDCLAADLFMEEIQNSNNLPIIWECTIEKDRVTLPSGEKVVALEDSELYHITSLFSELKLSRQMDDNIEVLNLFRGNDIKNPVKFAGFISEVYYILDYNYDYLSENSIQDWENKNPNLDKYIFELLLDVYNRKIDSTFLETIKILSAEWYGSGKELLETSLILHTNK